MALSERFIELDAWARVRPRLRDRLLLGSGVMALAAGLLAAVAGDSESPARPVAASMSVSQMQSVETQTRELNEMMDRMAQPWSIWLRDVLVDLPPGVMLLQVDLDSQTKRARLILRVEDFDVIDAVTARLERRGRFARLRVSGHERDAQGHVRVSLDGQMSAAPLAEARSP